ncbi:MAG: hypothetical protein E7396_08325 [Ruminococcaceae bacterium]|nr:hypothetical protein [Oscillospiraceae bacterium]
MTGDGYVVFIRDKRTVPLSLPATSDGEYIFETGDKLVLCDGDYEHPSFSTMITFEGLGEMEIEYGKEIFWNAAEEGASCKECCEIAQSMLGKGNVIARNMRTGETYWEGENDRTKGKNSRGTSSTDEIRFDISSEGPLRDVHFWHYSVDD